MRADTRYLRDGRKKGGFLHCEIYSSIKLTSCDKKEIYTIVTLVDSMYICLDSKGVGRVTTSATGAITRVRMSVVKRALFEFGIN